MAGARAVVITDCDHDSVEPERRVLAGHGVELRRLQCRTPEEVAEQAGGADVLNQYVPITAEVLDALPGCRLVVRYGVGVDNVDLEAAARRGVWVANVPDYGRDEVAGRLVLRGGLPHPEDRGRPGGPPGPPGRPAPLPGQPAGGPPMTPPIPFLERLGVVPVVRSPSHGLERWRRPDDAADPGVAVAPAAAHADRPLSGAQWRW